MNIFDTFPTVNISKLIFCLVICIAKNFIWKILKAISSIFLFFLHPQIPDFQIVVSVKYCPILNLVSQLSDDV